MQDSPLKTNMIIQAETSVLNLLKQIDYLLTAINHHVHATETAGMKTASEQIVRDNILSVVGQLRSLPYMLGDMVSRWKSNSPQILSRNGVEIEILNETMATLSATFCFMLSRSIDVGEFKHAECEEAYQNLKTCNRLLTEI